MFARWQPVLMAGLLFAVGCSRAPQAAAPPSEPVKPVASVSADAILVEYQQNVLAADTKYKEKYVEVKGQFARVGRGLMGDPYVQLGSGSPEEGIGVTCYLTKAAEAEAAQLKPGAQVTMRGTCKGLYGGMALRFFDCEFVK
jgi:hypothetical protein